MNSVRNYDRELRNILAHLEQKAPKRLLLHACCAPCSSYVLEYLSAYFSITLLFYNPNIYPVEEFEKRLCELKKLAACVKTPNPVTVTECGDCSEDFMAICTGLEDEREGGSRCLACYELRLRKAAEAARDGGFDYFTTTLSISPMKNAEAINEIGERLALEYGVKYLPSDFKKRDGYKRSIELSKLYGLYRQNYCGCKFSLRDRNLSESSESERN